MLCVSWGGDSLAAVLPGPFPLLMALSYCSRKSVLCKSLLCPPAWSVPVPLLLLRAGSALCLCTGCAGLCSGCLGKPKCGKKPIKILSIFSHSYVFQASEEATKQRSEAGCVMVPQLRGVHVWENEPVCSTGAVCLQNMHLKVAFRFSWGLSLHPWSPKLGIFSE